MTELNKGLIAAQKKRKALAINLHQNISRALHALSESQCNGLVIINLPQNNKSGG